MQSPRKRSAAQRNSQFNSCHIYTLRFKRLSVRRHTWPLRRDKSTCKSILPLRNMYARSEQLLVANSENPRVKVVGLFEALRQKSIICHKHTESEGRHAIFDGTAFQWNERLHEGTYLRFHGLCGTFILICPKTLHGSRENRTWQLTIRIASME